eukprot:3536179-Pyramimonas_sp.AAC.1
MLTGCLARSSLSQVISLLLLCPLGHVTIAAFLPILSCALRCAKDGAIASGDATDLPAHFELCSADQRRHNCFRWWGGPLSVYCLPTIISKLMPYIVLSWKGV